MLLKLQAGFFLAAADALRERERPTLPNVSLSADSSLKCRFLKQSKLPLWPFEVVHVKCLISEKKFTL